MESKQEQNIAQEARLTKREAKEYLYITLEIGTEMLLSGAEVSRVEDSIERICKSFGAERVDVLTITASIICTIYTKDYGPVTQSRRIHGQQTNLHRLEELNQLSRKICMERLNREEVREELDTILNRRGFSFFTLMCMFALASGMFSLFFGGSVGDAIASACIGVMIKWMDATSKKMRINTFLSALLCSLIGGVLAAVFVYMGLGDSMSMISIGNIMLLIPGLALTNSMRDMFSGDTVSGTMRFVESILLAMTIAFGFAKAAQFCGNVFKIQEVAENPVFSQTMTYLIQLGTVFIGTMAFSIIFNINKNKIWEAAIGGVLGWGVYLLLGCWLQSDPVKFLIASLILTFYSEICAKIKKTPTTIFLVSAAIPLLPGGFLYKTLRYGVEGDWTSFRRQGMLTFLVALAIAVGMLFGRFVMRFQTNVKYLKKEKGRA